MNDLQSIEKRYDRQNKVLQGSVDGLFPDIKTDAS
jgi:hypothetical protein